MEIYSNKSALDSKMGTRDAATGILFPAATVDRDGTVGKSKYALLTLFEQAAKLLAASSDFRVYASDTAGNETTLATQTTTKVTVSAGKIGDTAIAAGTVDFATAGGGYSNCTKNLFIKSDNTLGIADDWTGAKLRLAVVTIGANGIVTGIDNAPKWEQVFGFMTAARPQFRGFSETEPGSSGQTQLISGLSAPLTAAFDGSGNLYVLCNGDGTIQKFDTSLTQTQFASGLSNPYGITLDGSGNVYVACYGGTVEKFDSLGNQTTLATGLPACQGIVWDGSAYLYVACNDGTIQKVDGSGTATQLASGLGNPNSIAFDGSGNLVVGCYDGTIQKIDSGGTVTLFATGTEGYVGLAIDASGNILASNQGGGFIDKFDSGAVKTTYATGLSQPFGLSYSGGALYAVCYGDGTVQKFAQASGITPFIGDQWVDTTSGYVLKIWDGSAWQAMGTGA